jgi:DNA-binding MurR/RpiR family transcriptional regulator
LRGALSPAEQRACDALLHLAAHPRSLAIAEIARRADVSEATVTRMCHHLQFESFQALKLALVADAAHAAKPGHVLIGISHTGRTESVVTALRRGRTRGAAVIAITHDAQSPIAEVADILVVTAARATDLPTDELSGRSAQLLIFDAVYTVLALEDLAEGRSGLTDVTAAFDRQRLR